MDRIVIKGGKRLSGEVGISGSKNSALPLLASTLLSSGEATFFNVPSLKDVETICHLLTRLGARVRGGDGILHVEVKDPVAVEAPYDLVKTMRASILVLGPLTARVGEARVSLPGGCAIGARPINLHLSGLEKLGADIRIEHGYVCAKAKRLKGARISLDLPSVTGTENLMMAASLAEGTTVIENCAREPEVTDLAAFLNKRGARIHGAGTSVMTIHGVRELTGAQHRIIPDRVEAGTYMVAAAMTRGDVFVKGCLPETMEALLLKLREAGVTLEEEKEGVRVRARERTQPVSLYTMPYPGFPTDMQAQFMALMALSSGTSVLTETVFENRYTHVGELRRMGADITVQGNTAIVRGVKGLSGAPVMASDLRASACLVLAGLAAEGETEVSRVYHLDRGYERLEEKLIGLGANMTRLKR